MEKRNKQFNANFSKLITVCCRCNFILMSRGLCPRMDTSMGTSMTQRTVAIINQVVASRRQWRLITTSGARETSPLFKTKNIRRAHRAPCENSTRGPTKYYRPHARPTSWAPGHTDPPRSSPLRQKTLIIFRGGELKGVSVWRGVQFISYLHPLFINILGEEKKTIW